ncbi:hypothetical protein, conserved in T.vivax [Trypanosoma vivax Y486]|uniref:Uncharacterized protein n=1 Tax=Trypanosoma vivax (strain Y486) TaxID=1055687 RepID=F9WQX3_TRYVY|nr:hypothetical protein, conserved in T.vivax [Trypanosoma vivax Y486]|eukprot:CCD19955.1 hypothetical protein, conserved in T.vivax [Trypanosoma vivax Y486]
MTAGVARILLALFAGCFCVLARSAAGGSDKAIAGDDMGKVCSASSALKATAARAGEEMLGAEERTRHAVGNASAWQHTVQEQAANMSGTGKQAAAWAKEETDKRIAKAADALRRVQRAALSVARRATRAAARIDEMVILFTTYTSKTSSGLACVKAGSTRTKPTSYGDGALTWAAGKGSTLKGCADEKWTKGTTDLATDAAKLAETTKALGKLGAGTAGKLFDGATTSSGVQHACPLLSGSGSSAITTDYAQIYDTQYDSSTLTQMGGLWQVSAKSNAVVLDLVEEDTDTVETSKKQPLKQLRADAAALWKSINATEPDTEEAETLEQALQQLAALPATAFSVGTQSGERTAEEWVQLEATLAQQKKHAAKRGPTRNDAGTAEQEGAQAITGGEATTVTDGRGEETHTQATTGDKSAASSGTQRLYRAWALLAANTLGANARGAQHSGARGRLA